MKRTFSMLFLLFTISSIYSQNYDLIVTQKGDSIACYLDSITDSYIYFEMKSHGKWVHTHMDKNKVVEYHREVINKKLYIFKPSSSYIQSTKTQFYTDYNIHKNSMTLANDHIFSVTLSYERIIPLENKWNVALRAGSGITLESGTDWAIIGQVSTLYGESKHFLETGATYYHNLTYPDAFIIPLIGYRFMGRRGFILRAYGTMRIDIIDHSEWGMVNPGFHLAIGYRFKI